MRAHLVLLPAVLIPFLAGCPSETPALCDNGACDADGGNADSSPTDGGIDGVAPPDGCDPAADPKDAPKCVVNEFGIFVDAATGNDGNTGTKELPLKSITAALTKLSGRPRIYVCDGTYPETVKLNSPVSIFGGFACGTWTYSGAQPKVAPGSGTALIINAVNRSVVADVAFLSVAASGKPGDSAIAIFAANSSELVFRRLNVTAGDATPGAVGGVRTNYSGATATKGGDAVGAVAGKGEVCTCTDMTKSTGGNGAAGNGADFSDGSAEPAVGVANAGASKTMTCDPGLEGANGLAPAAAATIALPGAVSAEGWTSQAVVPPAPNGRPGQGGGGAGAKTNSTSAGGGGGCGGCGGAGGGAGGNGGSSFALLSFASSITLEGGTYTAGSAGKGGAGAAGQNGQAGGAAGIGAACDGGPGGHGSGGSGGSGGAGGHSAAVAFSGAEPSANGTNLVPGVKGTGGAGGDAGTSSGNAGVAGPAGADGKSQNSLAL